MDGEKEGSSFTRKIRMEAKFYTFKSFRLATCTRASTANYHTYKHRRSIISCPAVPTIGWKGEKEKEVKGGRVGLVKILLFNKFVQGLYKNDVKKSKEKSEIGMQDGSISSILSLDYFHL